ncbi:AMP-binding enzyme family protein [Mycobacterium avium subsp. avium 2285 (R)]|nr:AMP-binding enzyme family protein [Mycobacterium avium subsp. avium 2285 (R)]
MILLTSGTTGTPKGAKQSGGNAGIGTLKAILDRTPWRAEEPVVIVAPMFHAWGFSQLLLAASFACPVITRRKFDPEATLDLIDRHRATGLVVVPVMFDRIMDLPAEVRRRYECRSLRFAAASGSRMRPDVVVAFMDEFGDVIYNNYNATEAGMIATATPADLRAAPTPPAGPPAAPKSGSWTRNSTSCPPARWAPSTSATTPSSTDTPRAAARTSTKASCPRAISGTWTPRAGCSWSAATTR